MELSNSQSKIVLSDDSEIVTSIPGSGKTRVLIAKVMHLINQGIEDITLITYTRASANEMKDRLKKVLGRNIDTIKIGTFHSLIIEHISSYSNYNLVSSHTIITKLHELYFNKFNESDEFDLFKEYFEKKASNSLSETIKEYEELIEEFQETRSDNSTSLMEVINVAQKLIEQGQIPLLPTRWLLVDEFQDVDAVQLKFILSHALNDIKVLLVGDSDQNLYVFRSSLGHKAFVLAKDILGISEKEINTNYRSHSEILFHAKLLIDKNKGRYAKDLISDKGAGGFVNAYKVRTLDDEAYFISQMIIHNKQTNVAIISRTNFRLKRIEETLKAYNIEFSRRSVGSQYTPSENVFISILTALSNKNNSLLSSALMPFFLDEEEPYLLSLQLFNSKIKTNPSQIFTRYFKEIKGIYLSIINKNISGALDRLEPFVIDLYSSINMKNTARIKGLVKKVNRIKGTLNERLHKMDLKLNSDSGIQTMTGHSSKGLEFEVVYLVGCTEGVIPTKEAVEAYSNDGIEEERRIFYVGMTRAIRGLIITYAKTIQRGKTAVLCHASRYIHEAEITIQEVKNVADFNYKEGYINETDY